MKRWLLLAFAIGCAEDPPLPGPAEWNRQTVAPADTEAETRRASCAYRAGALPNETQGKSRPMGRDIPIDHIVVIMMENRSFDHYFQKLGIPGAEVAPADFTNPDLDGKPVGITRDTQLCIVDPAHGWNAVHRQINGGTMDGFFKTNNGNHELPMMGSLEMLSGARALTYYEPEDIPFVKYAATQFAIGDRYFCSLPGPTWPNRMYLYGASSHGKTSNEFAMNADNIFDRMQQRKINWAVYYNRLPGFGVFVDRATFYWGSEEVEQRLPKVPKFFDDAAAGKLPQVAFVDPDIGHEGPGQDDEHPPAIMQYGQAFLARVVDALVKSPNWKRTALFITYDEHGGFYDHVPPPEACPPDDIAPELRTNDEPGAFDRLGPRVPFFVISPYAKKGYVGHRVYDHTSITRFIEARWQIPAITNRDANAEAPWEMFDFDSTPNLSPPAPPSVATDAQRLEECFQWFPKEEAPPI